MSISWSTSKAGYDPGQSQSLKITFESRDIGKVKVSYVFKAHSLGRDDYTYSQRRNVVTISADGGSTSFKYQLHGNKASTTKSGSFYINNVGNGVTSLNIYYKNDRVGTNTPNYGPKSTGKVSKTRVGSLPISDNVKYTVNYNNGYTGGNVSNLPGGSTLYKGTQFRIPTNILVDNVNHYVFKLGYTTSKSASVNLYNPSAGVNSLQTLMSNITYYACWKPQTYRYRFFNKVGNVINEYEKLKTSYTYTYPAITLPNLNELTENNTLVNNEYYKTGYSFDGWTNQKNIKFEKDDLSCSVDYDSDFYVDWKAISSKINFNYGFEDKIESFNYTYDTQFDFKNALLGKKDTLIRPGYKLVGWSYVPQEKIYLPFETDSLQGVYKYGANSVADRVIYKDSSFSNKNFIDLGIDLYAVWEYYTTLFIYVDNQWKLALPYMYNDGSHKISLTYDYVTTKPGENPSWKL